MTISLIAASHGTSVPAAREAISALEQTGLDDYQAELRVAEAMLRSTQRKAARLKQGPMNLPYLAREHRDVESDLDHQADMIDLLRKKLGQISGPLTFRGAKHLGRKQV